MLHLIAKHAGTAMAVALLTTTLVIAWVLYA